jgi:hypothetical protein
MTTWVNEDGLRVKFPLTSAQVVTDGATAGKQEMTLEVVIPGADLPAIATGGREDIAHLPAGALITDAFLVATTGFGTDTGTLTVGLAKSDGTALDADGIDASVDVSAVLAAVGDVVACDGALVDKTETISERAWVYATASGTVTTGTVKLVLKYINTN